jgi:hypothetical protein
VDYFNSLLGRHTLIAVLVVSASLTLLAGHAYLYGRDKPDFPDGYDAVQVAPDTHKVIFENALVRVLEVTVPPAGGSPDLLWERFTEAFGLTGIDLLLDGDRVNPSLGAPETALIRRINRAANDVLEPADYRPLVRELLAHQTLSARTASPREAGTG